MLYLPLCLHCREPSGSASGISGLLCSVAWSRWWGGCGTLHWLLNWFHNRGPIWCTSLLFCQPSKALVAHIPFHFHMLVSKYEGYPGYQYSYPTAPNTGDGLYGIDVDKWDSLWFNNLSWKFTSKIWSDKSYPMTPPICCQGCIFIACYFYI